ncbi:MAG: hypothetical protein A2664_00375 [Candidatus Taylorbacteria bacterium RIFCSPHIGHO2_01_FULL_46_22b]|uniref:Uncharacterized protein n=1 Tax=Candidatus Taylorbacteria bacterium RIFCSPHIGHO2_01_FULL_46_22b TaxID=1802301 RepID=A0A1G2M6C1_9BACT|nr:MAG: hypothetical protein A2664_00375 [Candidatus Taylorbacteria bacterium RIFCSPHIGHO2_01_FULL_46_22b]
MRHLDFVLWVTFPLIMWAVCRLATSIQSLRPPPENVGNQDPRVLKPLIWILYIGISIPWALIAQEIWYAAR